jgi:hypothetical protein
LYFFQRTYCLISEQNFDLDKSRQKFHHSLKERHKISNIPAFRCEMLLNADNIALRNLPFFSHFELRTRNTFFQKAVSISRA